MTHSRQVFCKVQVQLTFLKLLLKNITFLIIIDDFFIYVILGILYENFIHPVTVMTALPPAGHRRITHPSLFHEPYFSLCLCWIDYVTRNCS